jgi:hypothetical protein
MQAHAAVPGSETEHFLSFSLSEKTYLPHGFDETFVTACNVRGTNVKLGDQQAEALPAFTTVRCFSAHRPD